MNQPITIEFDDAGVKKTIFTLPPTRSPDSLSVYAFSLPKAGSVLLDSIMRALSAAVGLTHVSIMGEFFRLGLADRDIPGTTSNIFRNAGYCYGGFRYFPERFEIPNLATHKAILLVRDPRDMVVSHYFSTRSSHPDPGKALSTSMRAMPARQRAQTLAVDEYVLTLTKFYSRHLRRYVEILEENPETFRVFRYEDVIFKKREWVADICAAFGWSVSEAAMNKIADKNDILPRSEKETKHIRQVVPGDYKRKLQPATIEKLTELFDRELDYFGYPKMVDAETDEDTAPSG